MRLPSSRGFALAYGLWVVALLAASAVLLSAASRSRYREDRVLANRLQYREAAIGAAVLTVAKLDGGTGQGWPVAGPWPRVVEYAGYSFSVTVEDEAGKVDVNAASSTVVASALAAVGRPTAMGQVLGQRLDALRLSGERVATVEEACQLAGGHTADLAAMRRVLTVYTGAAAPRGDIAPPELRTLAAQAARGPDAAKGSGTYRVVVALAVPNGAYSAQGVVDARNGMGRIKWLQALVD